MPLVAFSLRLDKINEALLYEDRNGHWWLNAICTFEEDAKGRLVVAQSVPKERYQAGEKGPPFGTWREIGSKDKPTDHEQGKRFDLAKYRNQPGSNSPNEHSPAKEAFTPSPQSSAQSADNGPQPQTQDFEDPGF